jgi:DNA replication protein DnaC
VSERRELKAREPERENNRIVSGAERFRMGSSYYDANLPSWISPPEFQKKVSDWFRNSKPFLVVTGGPGTGKTYMSAAILNYFFDQKREVFYTTHRRFIEKIHLDIQEGRSQHCLIDYYCEKDILIFDDLGAAVNTEWQQEMILELIDRRYSDKKKTVFTSNLNKKQINDKLGFRTASRMFDHNNEFFEVQSPDRRGFSLD